MGKSRGAKSPSNSGIPPWPAAFPRVLTHVSLQRLYCAGQRRGEALDESGRSAAYRAAKAGDADAAKRVVEEVVDPQLIIEMTKTSPRAMVASVHAQEAAGVNKLSVMYARAMADIGGFQVEEEIVQTNRAQHTGATARQRLARTVEFAGAVQKGRDYIVVDDVITSGSSLAALRHYIEACGARVVLASTLAAAAARHGHDPVQLAITAQTVKGLEQKFAREAVDAIIEEYGIAPSINHLTESQGRAVLGFESIDALRSSLVAARQARGPA